MDTHTRRHARTHAHTHALYNMRQAVDVSLLKNPKAYAKGAADTPGCMDTVGKNKTRRKAQNGTEDTSNGSTLAIYTAQHTGNHTTGNHTK